MIDAFYTRVTRWQLPTRLFRESIAELARDGVHGNEGIVLWLGHRQGGIATATHLVYLRGPGVLKLPLHLRVDAGLFNDVSDAAIGLGLTLIGQAHSHGPGDYVELSSSDLAGGIQVPYFLSIVVPRYALDPETGVEECGVHYFNPKKGYARLSRRSVGARVRIVDELPFDRLTIGR